MAGVVVPMMKIGAAYTEYASLFEVTK